MEKKMSKFITKEMFRNLEEYLQKNKIIARSRLCREIPFLNINTLKNANSNNDGITIVADTGQDVFYSAEGIIEYIRQKFKIVDNITEAKRKEKELKEQGKFKPVIRPKGFTYGGKINEDE